MQLPGLEYFENRLIYDVEVFYRYIMRESFNTYFIYLRLNYKLHPLSLVKVQFSLLSFDHFNLVL